MSNSSVRSDYYWSYTDEPHHSRRKEILQKYPQIKQLFGHDTNTKYVVFCWLFAQFSAAFLLKDATWFTIVVMIYIFGAFANHALFLAMHEISHNLAFSSPTTNRIFGIVANITTVVPHFTMFQKYHMEHHQYQGVDGIDADIPSRWEGWVFTNTIKKVVWMSFQPLWYLIRPLLIKPKNPGFWEAMNWGTVIAVNIVIYNSWGFKALFYMFLSGFIGSGLHPAAGHFIAEHYVFITGQETYSYYGHMHMIFFNVGYHNEHHDFPRIPGSRLPEVKKIAPEYYDKLPSYTSYCKVIWTYITDPTVGPFSRVVRKSNDKKRSS